ncbi:hypothetical protein CTI12_AA519530 [Artemisia annua]|uniref:Transposase, Ptta/En/Spm n=1 Tax=Artemisia annua TaxID=35608 RepID=A0A2U1L842_ARTAN|nr:hypothetical protein CTI12_AA519530 [Artemisia annua]
MVSRCFTTRYQHESLMHTWNEQFIVGFDFSKLETTIKGLLMYVNGCNSVSSLAEIRGLLVYVNGCKGVSSLAENKGLLVYVRGCKRGSLLAEISGLLVYVKGCKCVSSLAEFGIFLLNMKRTLEKRSTSNSKKPSYACRGSTSLACSAGRVDVSDVVADDMNSNIQSLVRPSNRSCSGDKGRHTSSQSVSHVRVSNSPNLVGLENEADVHVEPHVDAVEVATNTSQTQHGPNAADTRRVDVVEVATNTSQTRRGPNASEIRPDNPFVNNPGVVRKISKILRNAFHGPWATWKEVDEASWNELLYRWDPCIEKEVYDAWEAWLRKNFRGFMAEVRDEAKIKYTEATGIVFDGENYSFLASYGPNWIRDDRWQDLINRVWNSPKWREKSRKASKNRNTEVDGSVGKHTCGSATMTQYRLNKEKETGAPVSFQVLFEDTHSQTGEYITPKTKTVGETYKEKLLIKHGSDKSLHPTGDINLWLDCSGGKVKGRTFGTSSLSDPHFLMTGIPSTPSNCRSHHESLTSEVQRLEEKLEKQREDGVRREIALRKEFEDQREDDRREWQAKLKEFQDIVLGKSPHPLPPN